MEQEAKKKAIINIVFAFLIGLLIYISGNFLIGYLLPFIIAFIISCAVQSLARKISSKLNINTGLCAAILAVMCYLIAAALLFWIFYGVVTGARNYLNTFLGYYGSISEMLNSFKNRFLNVLSNISPELRDQINKFITDSLDEIGNKLTVFFSSAAANMAGAVPSFIFSFIVTLVANCYIAKDFNKLSRFLKELCGKKIYSNILKIKKIISTSVFSLLRGYIILMFITFIQLTVVFLLLKIKYAVILALLISFIDILPVFGTGTVLIPWCIIEFASGKTALAAVLLILYLTVTLIRNLIEPKIIGGQIGINPLFTLTAMFVGLKLFGFLGLVLFPLTLITVIKYYKEEIEYEKSVASLS